MASMPASPQVTVRIDLEKVRDNARSIKSLTGVELMAVVKADAYGLGAEKITAALADVADGFCVLNLSEAIAADIWRRTDKPSIALGPDDDAGPDDYLAQHVRPGVWDVNRAAALGRARPILSVDTGMQRFACPAGQIESVLKCADFDEAFTHATSLDRVKLLLQRVGNRGFKLHAAGSSLLGEPAARLDAVRPGLALYESAVRVSTRLIEARKSDGPIGYSGFTSAYHGVIPIGYSQGLRPGPCLINNRNARILEVGMQTAFCEIAGSDKVGEEVVLLGDSLKLQDIAVAWKSSPHEVLTRMCGAFARRQDPSVPALKIFP
ncbi:MAG TPA: alanine racemase [Tepidisphaeraceae bacterium]|jgi:alanine racemase|nr:alanine racemase [Tepidisphaeraceae bacterium]